MIEASNFQSVKLRIQLQLSLSLSLSLSQDSPLPGLTASLLRICLLSEFHTMHATNDRRALSLSLSFRLHRLVDNQRRPVPGFRTDPGPVRDTSPLRQTGLGRHV
jgi:hypothetical protein